MSRQVVITGEHGWGLSVTGNAVQFDLDALPSEMIEAAARRLAEKVETRNNQGKPITSREVGRWAQDVLRAALSVELGGQE